MMISKSTDTPIISDIKVQVVFTETKKKWKILDDFHYRRLVDNRTSEILTIKAPFLSDLGSVPRFLWRVVGPHEFPCSFILHDGLYHNKKVTRSYADRLLYECLQYEKCGKFRAWLIYTVVSLYGYKYWKQTGE